MKSIPQVFDHNMRRLAYLDNAMNVTYELPLNAIWTASFALPADDLKNEYCSTFNFVEIFDGEERIDLFRIIGEDLTRSDDAIRVYNCEHVLATLLNDVLFQYHQIGGIGIKTPTVLNYILGQQTVTRWQLSECDFQRQFEYNFENDNLLAALFAVPNCFDTEYQWTWDTTVYPWLLSLKAPGNDIDCEIRYRKNLLGISKTVDDTQIANRIYALGYGEGVNQLDITSVNNGAPYVEDINSQAEYGVISTILVDSRFELPENLKAYAKQILEQTANPYISYEVEALDLFRMDKDDFGRFWPGRLVRVLDTEDGITIRTRIVSVRKDDLRGDPGSISVTLANKDRDIAGSISDLQNRALINETYAQGATNLQVQNFADNADANHPATFFCWIPSSAVRINKMSLHVQFEAFRGYSNAVSSTTINLQSTESGGSATRTSSSTELLAVNMEADQDGSGPGYAKHNHGLYDGVRLAVCNYNNEVIDNIGFVASGAHTHGNHDHTVSIPSHYHSIDMPSHSHTMQ